MNDSVPDTTTDKAPDPFDPASLRLSQDFAATGATKKLLTRVPVRKPGKQEFVRVRSGEDWRLATMLLEDAVSRETYVVAPALHGELADEAMPAILFTAISKAGDVFLWIVKAPKADGSTNPWNESALAATEEAERGWVKVVSNMGAGMYDVHAAVANFPDPEWPDVSFGELLKLAFKGRLIDSLDHDLLRKLRGEI